MPIGFSTVNRLVRDRPPGIPTTNVTNELGRAIQRVALVRVDRSQGGVGPYVAKVTGNAAGKGKYDASIYVPTRDLLTPSRDVTSTDIELFRLTESALLVNLQENGASGWDLTASENTLQLYFTCDFAGDTFETTPRMAFIVNGIWTAPCDTTAGGSESVSEFGGGEFT